MKLAVSGKGGVGKTTFSALLIRALADQGKKVLAIDADPDANLAQALGVDRDREIIPISEMKAIIEERTEAKVGTMGSFFKLNPKVDDLPDTIAKQVDGLKFMTLGGVKKGGAGCVCPESVLLKNLVMHLVLYRDDVVIMDMEAGLEHLGRGTSQSVDKLIVVVEPGRRSLDTAEAVKRLANDLKMKYIGVVGNKVRNERDAQFIEKNLAGFEILGHIPYSDEIVEADLAGKAVYDMSPIAVEAIRKIYEKLVKE